MAVSWATHSPQEERQGETLGLGVVTATVASTLDYLDQRKQFWKHQDPKNVVNIGGGGGGGGGR